MRKRKAEFFHKYVEVETDLGMVILPHRLLHQLVEHIILSVPGVEALEKSSEESVRIEFRKKVIYISLYVVLNLTKRVPEVSWELQKKLKEKFESQTGLRLERIDINVQEFSALGLNDDISPVLVP